jgi:hypothetical protein
LPSPSGRGMGEGLAGDPNLLSMLREMNSPGEYISHKGFDLD